MSGGELFGHCLPESWELVTVGDVARVVGGSTPKSRERRYWGGEIPWLAVADLTGYSEKRIAHGARSITQEGYESCATHLLPTGSVVFSSRAPVGYVAIAANPLCTSQGFKSLALPSSISSDFVYWWMKAARPLAEALASGTTFKEISGKATAAIPLPLPPRAEQDRIVDAIETAMGILTASEEPLDTARARAEVLGRRILEQAISGAWPQRKMKELLREPLRNGHSAKAVDEGAGVRTLTLTAVTQREFVDANTKLTNADPVRVKDLWLEPDDVLVERSNTPELVGTAARYDGPKEWAIFPDLLIRVRTNDELSAAFLELLLRAPSVRERVRSRAQGIAGSMPKISQETIEELDIPVPPIDEQIRVVVRTTQQLGAVETSTAEIDHARQAQARLKTSILRYAFTGRLAPQNAAERGASNLRKVIEGEKAQLERDLKMTKRKGRKRRGGGAKRNAKAQARSGGNP